MSEPPVLALHGNIGAATDWEQLGIESLRAVSLWEHADLSFFEMAHVLATTLSEGMDRPILAGYSLGGRLALHAMAIHPDRWGGAVIASAHPGLETAEERAERRSHDANWARVARELPWAEFLEEWNAQAVFDGRGATPEQLALARQRDSVALAFESWSLGAQGDLRTQLKRFCEPVLVISGENDAKFRELGDELAATLPRAEHVILPGQGHRVLGPALAEEINQWRARL